MVIKEALIFCTKGKKKESKNKLKECIIWQKMNL